MRKLLAILFLLASFPYGKPCFGQAATQGALPAGTPAANKSPFVVAGQGPTGTARIVATDDAGFVLTGAAPTTYAKTYRVAFSVAAPVGDFFEVRGTTHTARIARIFVAKPAAGFLFTVAKRSTLDGSGTATTPTPLPTDSSFVAAFVAPKLYTVAPTAGTLVANVAPPVSIGTGDYVEYTFGDRWAAPLTVRNGEAVALVSDTATTIPGFVKWTED